MILIKRVSAYTLLKFDLMEIAETTNEQECNEIFENIAISKNLYEFFE